MSTWLYLECKDHSPPLGAEGESGQHLYDLPQIQADLADRVVLVSAAQIDSWPDDRYRRNTVRFLREHPTCRIGIRDEYGTEHPTDVEQIA